MLVYNGKLLCWFETCVVFKQQQVLILDMDLVFYYYHPLQWPHQGTQRAQYHQQLSLLMTGVMGAVLYQYGYGFYQHMCRIGDECVLLIW